MSRTGSTRRLALLAAVAAVLVAALVGRLAHASGTQAPATKGVVIVDTTLGLEGGQAAGTGMVLTPSGEVLTNNHVIAGATSISVVVPQTGRRYRATVLGYDVAGDTALLKLSGASGLATVSAGTGARAAPGQAVRAVGNAGGAGSLTVVRGTVTGLARSITVNTDRGTTQRLTGLIETNAPLRPGDSGGPLLDARGRVLGIDTAASVANGFVFQTSADDGYAIPIARALGVVRKIESGTASATVHVGPTAFLGIQAAATDQNGVGVAGVVPGSPADHAGLQEGDMITSVDSTPVASPRALVSLLLQKKPGRTITLVWTDRYGNRQSGSAKLVAGPPQ